MLWCTQLGAQVSRGFPELEPIDVDHLMKEKGVFQVAGSQDLFISWMHLR